MKLELDIQCPGCKRKFKQVVGEMVAGRSRKCPSCGAVIQFGDSHGRNAQKAMDDLERTLS